MLYDWNEITRRAASTQRLFRSEAAVYGSHPETAPGG
jgi:predicted nuclease with RNAse H fold